MPNKKIFHDSDESDVAEDDVSEHVVESEGSDEDVVQENDEDSDAAPEDVAFSTSKADALRKVKDAMINIGKEKERKKQKRKEQDDKFKQQKKQKLDELAKNRLPDDFLASITSHAPPVIEEVPTSPEQISQDGSSEQHGLDMLDEDCNSDADTDDFISLGNSNVKAVFIKDQDKTARSAVDEAKAFRDKRLYGGKIRRQSEKARVSMVQKKRARYR